ncbi:MAG: DUF2161 family putative PD-(D/E)XK-type phosphodiesterase [Henriciella sp.]|nr:DUF2161 family putative PD-(D/E)XK-type phosphodiesterase [Henriciella sp.]
MSSQPARETDLYAPIKQLLEQQGYEVKGEVGAADIVGLRGHEAPVIVELKTTFSLSLFHQAIDRLGMTDVVYIAVPHKSGKLSSKLLKRNVALCRRLGIGLITVRLKDGSVYVHLDPGMATPRLSRLKQARLLREFSRRVGDPNSGGATRKGLITAYRQDALRCLSFLRDNGPTKASHVAVATQVENSRRIMADDHYGWFERVETGIYAITPKGHEAMLSYKQELAKLAG